MKSVTSEEEYSKNKYIKPDDVNILMTWVDDQDHLPKISELEALIFLSGQLGNQELAKSKIEVYYSSRTKLIEFFKNRRPNHSDIELVAYTNLELPKQYDRTIFCHIMDSDPSKFNVSEQVKIVAMVSDLCILQEGSAPGYQYVVDASGAQFGHLLKLRLDILKKSIFVLQETLPIIVSYVHVINVSPVVEKLFFLAKPFIKSYLRNKIIFHSNGIESLYQYVPKEYLPQDLGGNGPTFKELHNKMKQMLVESEDYFVEEERTKRADESRRKEK